MSTTTPTDAVLAAGIRSRRTALGLTQLRLASIAGVSLTHSTNIEQGCVPRGGDAVARIVAALAELEAAAGSA